ncbi:hypothetical protein QQ045_022985 [Rhodiola kirilowii]
MATVILLAFCHQKFAHILRPCLSLRRKKNKSVHLAEYVVEPSSDSVEFRKRHMWITTTNKHPSPDFDLNLNGSDYDDGGRRRQPWRWPSRPL